MSTADNLRRMFDREFALPLGAERESQIDLLAVRIGGQPYAVRLSEISGVFAARPSVGAPSSVPSFIGLAGVRGSIVPVFDLAILLGYAQSSAPRWLVLVAQMGFAFDVMEGHVRAPASALAREQSQSKHANEVIAVSGQSRPLVQLAAVVEAVTKKER
jgi:purine-binding chemotaxis protein CheW